MLTLQFTALSDVGRVRRDNQDSGYAGPHLLAVADGVGGSARGDVASTAVIQQVAELETAEDKNADAVRESVLAAGTRIAELVADNSTLEGTSTTATVGLFDGNTLHVAHIGDSRAYLLRNGELRQLTKDHTFVQSLVDEGRITDDEARVHPHRNLILRAVDGVREPEPDVESTELEAGDRLLFCSDGCCGALTDERLAELLGSNSLDRAAPELVAAAIEAGSTDNVTVVLAEVVEAEADSDAMPIQVGAVSHPYRPSGLADRIRRWLPETDPEALRYAPLPPRRFTWLRRFVVLFIVLVLAIAALYAAYKATQSRYYVGAAGDKVEIYRGVELSVFGHKLHHPQESTDLSLSALGDYDAAAVRRGIDYDTLEDARKRVKDLIAKHCQPLPIGTPVMIQGVPTKLTVAEVPAGCPGSGPTSPTAIPATPGQA